MTSSEEKQLSNKKNNRKLTQLASTLSLTDVR